MRRVKRSTDSHQLSLAMLCLFTVAPSIIAGVFWDAAFSAVPKTLSIGILAFGSAVYVWSHFCTKVFFAGDRLIVETPFRRREFTLEEMALLRGHGPDGLIAGRSWPYFSFSPGDYDLTPEESRIIQSVIVEKAKEPEGPNQSPEPTAMSVTPPAAQEPRQP